MFDEKIAKDEEVKRKDSEIAGMKALIERNAVELLVRQCDKKDPLIVEKYLIVAKHYEESNDKDSQMQMLLEAEKRI